MSIRPILEDTDVLISSFTQLWRMLGQVKIRIDGCRLFLPLLSRINYIVFAFYCLLCNCKKAAQIKNRPFEKFNLILDQKVGSRKL